MISSRTPLSSLKKCTVDEFESCESSPARIRSPRFGREEPSGGAPTDFDRKSSANSPLLTAGRLSFAPSMLDSRGRLRSTENKFTSTPPLFQPSHCAPPEAREPPPARPNSPKDIFASIDLMVQDILSITGSTQADEPAKRITFGRTERPAAAQPPLTSRNRTPREYKRRSLTARGNSSKLPDLLKLRQPEHGGCLTSRSRIRKPPPVSVHSDSDEERGTDEENAPSGALGLFVERRLSLSKQTDAPARPSVEVPEETRAELSSLSRSPELSASQPLSEGAPRASMDPFLFDTSPSPPTTPFKTAARPAAAVTAESPLPTSRSQQGEEHELDAEFANSCRKVTKRNRDRLASHYYAFYNQLVFDDQLPKALPIEWNSRFLRVSGRTTFRRRVAAAEDSGCPATPRVSQEDDDPPVSRSYVRSDALEAADEQRPKAGLKLTPVCITLSTKLLTTPERLRATLLHEMCHLAQRLIDEADQDGAHGPSFRKWAGIARAKAPDVKVSITHDYSLDAPHYRWHCLGCGQIYQRIQHSINCDEYVCNTCQGALQFLGRFDKTGNQMKSAVKRVSPYQEFIKENYQRVYALEKSTSLTMKKLGAMWQERKN